MARIGEDKPVIQRVIGAMGYDFSQKIDDFQQDKFDVSCQGTISRCIAIFRQTKGFESAMRKAVALGGDVDTNCAIVGSICQAYYGVPRKLVEEAYKRLPVEMADVVTAFIRKHVDKDFQEPEEVGTVIVDFKDIYSEHKKEEDAQEKVEENS